MKTAKVFKSGNSQAVRIPKEFHLEGEEVEIRRKGESLTLRTRGEIEQELDADASHDCFLERVARRQLNLPPSDN